MGRRNWPFFGYPKMGFKLGPFFEHRSRVVVQVRRVLSDPRAPQILVPNNTRAGSASVCAAKSSAPCACAGTRVRAMRLHVKCACAVSPACMYWPECKFELVDHFGPSAVLHAPLMHCCALPSATARQCINAPRRKHCANETCTRGRLCTHHLRRESPDRLCGPCTVGADGRPDDARWGDTRRPYSNMRHGGAFVILPARIPAGGFSLYSVYRHAFHAPVCRYVAV